MTRTGAASSTNRIMSWMVSPLSTWPPGELTKTSMGLSDAPASASSRPVTSRDLVGDGAEHQDLALAEQPGFELVDRRRQGLVVAGLARLGPDRLRHLGVVVVQPRVRPAVPVVRVVLL